MKFNDVIAEPDLDISTEWHQETVSNFPYLQTPHFQLSYRRNKPQLSFWYLLRIKLSPINASYYMGHRLSLIWTVPILRTSSADCNDFNLRILIGDSSVEYCVIGSLIRLIISLEAFPCFQLVATRDQSDVNIYSPQQKTSLSWNLEVILNYLRQDID